jgi:nitroreductase
MPETMETLRTLRSVHGNFTEARIPSDDLRTILDTSVVAANASNRQSYSIIVVDDPAAQKDLTGYAGAVTLVFCVDFNRIIDVAVHLGHSYTVQGFRAFVTGTIDVGLAAQTAAIAARSLGIDSLFTNGLHRGDMSRVYDRLNLPHAYCFPAIALVLGYPKSEPDHKRGRLSGPGVVHWGGYHRLTADEIDEIVAQYDEASNHLDLDVPWREEGFGHFLDWFYQVWSNPRQRPAGAGRIFDAFAATGFTDEGL